jgi:hypothetical protein
MCPAGEGPREGASPARPGWQLIRNMNLPQALSLARFFTYSLALRRNAFPERHGVMVEGKEVSANLRERP